MEKQAGRPRDSQSKHLDVVNLTPRKHQHGSANLVLTLAPGVPELILPAGTEFSARRGERKQEPVFVSEEDVRITNARVESLGVLNFDKDPLISPECDLDFITGIRAQSAGADTTRTDTSRLFVPETGQTSTSNDEANLGFAVASPLLHLTEGKRKIEFEISLDPIQFATETTDAKHSNQAEDGDAKPTSKENLAVALDALTSTEDPTDQMHAEWSWHFGRILTNEIMSAEPWLDAEAKDTIRWSAKKRFGTEKHFSTGNPLPNPDGLQVVYELLEKKRAELFNELFRDSLSGRCTSEEGWFDLDYCHIKPAEEGIGLTIVLDLGPETPAIVPYSEEIHGGGFDTDLPVVAFRVSSVAIFHPYSLLRRLELRSVAIEVTATGVTNLIGYNQLGQLDPTKQFQPFGPHPTVDSYLVLGCYEAARKPLVRASLKLEWTGLPTDVGGWRQYYNGYEEEYSSDSFKVGLTVLRDSLWQPIDRDRQREAQLFATEVKSDRLKREQTIHISGLEYLQPISPTLTEEDFQTLQRRRDGLFRLSLGASPVGFGHWAYPALIARTLTANARKKKPRPARNQPYTPTISRLSLDYVAKGVIALGSDPPRQTSRHGEKIFHVYPFGVRDLSHSSMDEELSLMPGGPVGHQRKELDGYLFIGISATQLAGPITMLVEMVGEVTGPVTNLCWFYLASNRWHCIDRSRILDDKTNGLNNSGIVTIDIPDHIDRANTILPSDFFWLAVGAEHFEEAGRLIHSVTAGAVKVVRQHGGNVRRTTQTELPQESINSTISHVVGLDGVTQVGPTFGACPSEDFDRFLPTPSESPRHEGRALTSWDYERLVLEHFPDISKVKYLPNTSVEAYPDPDPGHALVVVVPQLTRPTRNVGRIPLVSERLLACIHDVISRLVPSVTNISVRNAAYELVQIRCQVQFSSRDMDGREVQRLNEALIDFIAPWRPHGVGGRFCWSIHHEDFTSYMHDLPSVESVSDLSVLHISQSIKHPGRFHLRDTARRFKKGTPALLPKRPPQKDALGKSIPDNRVMAVYPWSLAFPSANHFIKVGSGLDGPFVTGIDELEIGNNFVIGVRQ